MKLLGELARNSKSLASINKDFIEALFFISSLIIAYISSNSLLTWLTLSVVATYFTLRTSYRYVLVITMLALITQAFRPTEFFTEFLTYFAIILIVRTFIGFKKASITYITPVLIACGLSLLKFSIYEFNIFNALTLVFISLISGYGLTGFQTFLYGLECEFKVLNLLDLRLPSLNSLFQYLSRAFFVGLLTYLLFLTVFRFTPLGFFNSVWVSLALTTVFSIMIFKKGLNIVTYVLIITLLILNYDYITASYFEGYEESIIEEVLRRFDGLI